MNEVGIFPIIWTQTLCANQKEKWVMVKTAGNTDETVCPTQTMTIPNSNPSWKNIIKKGFY
jgi:hypothetical protein